MADVVAVGKRDRGPRLDRQHMGNEHPVLLIHHGARSAGRSFSPLGDRINDGVAQCAAARVAHGDRQRGGVSDGGEENDREKKGGPHAGVVPRLFCALSILLVLLPAAAQDSLQWNGFALLRAAKAGGDKSWLDGGTGRFDEGGDAKLSAQLQLGVDWTPSLLWNAHLHLLASEDHVGVPEAYVDLRAREDRVRIRAGAFFLPASRENVDALWESPYTITPSALNSWMGEEFRPIGVDLQWTAPHGGLGAGATIYRGNDALGAVPAAFGWTWSDRWTTLGEHIPAYTPDSPDLISSVSDEVDGRLGWSARARWTGEHALVQLTHIDNRADGEQYGDLLTWATRFDIVGAEYNTTKWTFAGEYGWGPTAIPDFTLDLSTAYVLVSRRFTKGRATLRLATFDNTSVYGTDDSGTAITAAAFWEPRGPLRVGFEIISLDAERAGVPTQTNRVAVEVRWSFSKR